MADVVDVYEQNLGQKSSLTTSDYIRVVGSDNASYKQGMQSVIDTINAKKVGDALEFVRKLPAKRKRKGVHVPTAE